MSRRRSVWLASGASTSAETQSATRRGAAAPSRAAPGGPKQCQPPGEQQPDPCRGEAPAETLAEFGWGNRSRRPQKENTAGGGRSQPGTEQGTPDWARPQLGAAT